MDNRINELRDWLLAEIEQEQILQQDAEIAIMDSVGCSNPQPYDFAEAQEQLEVRNTSMCRSVTLREVKIKMDELSKVRNRDI